MIRTPLARLLIPLALGFTAACSDDGTEPPPPGTCDVLPAATVTCTDATCGATTGTKTYGRSELKSETAKDWLVVAWASSEVANQNIDYRYERAAPGGLSPRTGPRAIRPAISPELASVVYTPERIARLEAERRSGIL